MMSSIVLKSNLQTFILVPHHFQILKDYASKRIKKVLEQLQHHPNIKLAVVRLETNLPIKQGLVPHLASTRNLQTILRILLREDF